MGKVVTRTTLRGAPSHLAYWRSCPVEARIAGLPLPILSLDDFKASKRASGRPKDLADLHSLDEPDDDR